MTRASSCAASGPSTGYTWCHCSSETIYNGMPCGQWPSCITVGANGAPATFLLANLMHSVLELRVNKEKSENLPTYTYSYKWRGTEKRYCTNTSLYRCDGVRKKNDRKQS
eukprot:scaffold129720_cov31-Prasinocladus_malaysianus.AAC.3